MTRKKLNLAYITNDSMRKSTFNKRKKGLEKKMHELSVLCGIEACGIIYSPYTSNPDVWPSNYGVKKVVDKFEMVPETEQRKRMVNHEAFLIESINKTMENNNKKVKDNKERTMKEAMFMVLSGQGHFLKLNSVDRVEMCKYIDQYVKELYHHRNVTLNQQFLGNGETSSTSNVIAPTPIAAEVGSSSCPIHDGFNSSQLVNESWSLRPEQVNIFGNNLLSHHVTNNNQQGGYCQVMNQVSVYDQHSSLNLNQNQYQQHNQEWLVGQMMNHDHEQMRFTKMGDNNCYYHQQH